MKRFKFTHTKLAEVATRYKIGGGAETSRDLGAPALRALASLDWFWIWLSPDNRKLTTECGNQTSDSSRRLTVAYYVNKASPRADVKNFRVPPVGHSLGLGLGHARHQHYIMWLEADVGVRRIPIHNLPSHFFCVLTSDVRIILMLKFKFKSRGGCPHWSEAQAVAAHTHRERERKRKRIAEKNTQRERNARRQRKRNNQHTQS